MTAGAIEDRFDRGFRGGDPAAQWEFVDLVTPLLLGYVRGALRVRGSDIEEIVVETISRAVAKAKEIDPARPLLPYMYAVAHNFYVDRKRRAAAREEERPQGGGGGPPPREPHEAAAPTQEPWRRVHAAEVLAEFLACVRAKLDGTLLETFGSLVLHHWDNGLTARALRISRNSVAVRKSRIRVGAQPCFERFEGEI